MLQKSLNNSLILWLVLNLPATRYFLFASWFQMPFPTPRCFAPNELTNCIPSIESSLLKWPKTSLVLCKSKVCKDIKLCLSTPWNHAYRRSRGIAPLIRIFGARRWMANFTPRLPDRTETWVGCRAGVDDSENSKISSSFPESLKLCDGGGSYSGTVVKIQAF
jgi:hypothetical protein